MTDPRHDTPSFYRNIEPITQKLHEILRVDCNHILEIGSGSGQHVARFSREFPKFQFQPTEYELSNVRSINSWCEGLDNVSPALQLDVTQAVWFNQDTPKFDTLFCSNVIHITPWEITGSLFKGANTVMNKQCQLLFYGPYKIDGKQTAESNVEFDLWLKEKDASFGIRDISDVEDEAKNHGFRLENKHVMPANNFIMEFKRS